MGRKQAPQPLTLSDPTSPGDDPRPSETPRQVHSPLESRSPRSPRSPFRISPRRSQADRGKPSLQQADDPRDLDRSQNQNQTRLYNFHDDDDQDDQLFRPIASALNQTSLDTSAHPHPTVQQSLNDETKPSKSGFFFNFHKASKSSQQLHDPASSQQHHTILGGESMSRGTDNPAMLSKSSKHSDSSYADHSLQKLNPSLPSKSDLSLASTGDYETSPSQQQSSKKAKVKPFGLLSRTKSIRDKEGSRSPREQAIPPPVKIHNSDRPNPLGSAALRTAPMAQDRAFREMMTSTVRNRSEDRSAPRDMPMNKEHHRDKDHPRTQPSSYRERENGSSAFLSNLKNSSTRAADMIGRGLFGKGMRSGSTTEREPIVDDEHYVLKVINLPLVEQTRLTRISKRLEDSRDKTEFWMPAFPWRAIDYLNYKGSDVEGLYRVPGSGPQIKKWQRKFDEGYDVDLFTQDDLYDINIIGSMLKAWLRELPDELFPKEAQERISRECAGAETVPQMLIDELSNLSPFNYYLLFAITCHLSLLLAHADKNKMDFRNLCICFQPCMKIDAFCFKFLVCDWRDCWKGCKNEAKFIEEEYMLFDQPPPRGLGEPRRPEHGELQEDRNISSSDSSKQSSQSTDPQKGRLKKKALQLSESNGSVASNSTLSTALTINSERETPRKGDTIRPLSPIKPLSPLGF